MKLADWLPSKEQIELAQGIERTLLARRRAATFGAGAAGLLAVAQFVATLFDKYAGPFKGFYRNLWSGNFREIGVQDAPELVLLGLTVLGVSVWLVARRTSLLLKESEEPFRYTFSIEGFRGVEGTPGKRFELRGDDRFRLLHLDLTERLDRRIQRFSLLEPKPDKPTAGADAADAPTPAAHIHISGTYALREDIREGAWVIHVMPQVRIGPPGAPSSLAHPVRYHLTSPDEGLKDARRPPPAADVEPPPPRYLDAEQYNQLVERVYSSVATMIYERIDADIRAKILWFPTRYRRAIALYWEAHDLANSNTVDAYDRALQLYAESLRQFNSSFTRLWARSLLGFPALWRLSVRTTHMYARVEIGRARCLLARRSVSHMTGRASKPLFGVRQAMEKVREDLELLHRRITGATDIGRLGSFIAELSFPEDRLKRRVQGRPGEALFACQRELRFEAYAVSSLLHTHLGAHDQAEKLLLLAEAVAPSLTESNLVYLFARAASKPDVDDKVTLYRHLTDRHPSSQIGQYNLAFCSEMQLRRLGQFEWGRVKSVAEEYERVLRINPGNVGALAALGHLCWHADRPDDARRWFEEGLELKAIVRETFVGDLHSGLARVAAEGGKFEKSFDHYRQALAADPSLATLESSHSRQITAYFDSIGEAMLGRYARLALNVAQRAREQAKAAPESGKARAGVVDAVRGFALNDYGLAVFRYFLRSGEAQRLRHAVAAFDRAREASPDNAAVSFNLFTARDWLQDATQPASISDLREAVARLPGWQAGAVARLRFEARKFRNEADELRRKRGDRANEARALHRRRAELEEDLLGNQLATRFRLVRRDGSVKRLKEAGAQLQVDLLRLDDRRRKVHDEIRQIHDARKQRVEAWRKESEEIIDSILQSTKLSPLLEKTEPIADTLGRLLGDGKVLWTRLDEADAGAIIVIADALAADRGDADRLPMASRLYRKVLEVFYPEHFEASLGLYGLSAPRPGEDEADVAARVGVSADKLKSWRAAVGDSILRWVREDPVHYHTLRWLHEWAEFDVFEEAVMRAAGSPALSRRYRRDLAAACVAYARQCLADWQRAAESRHARTEQHLALAEKVDRGADVARDLLECRAAILRERGDAALGAGRHAEARDLYREAMQRWPQEVQHHERLARALEAERSIDSLGQAIAAVDDALRLPLSDRPRLDYLAWRARLVRKQRVVRDLDPTWLARLPLVHPIRIDVGHALVPVVSSRQGELDPKLTNGIENWRDKLEKETGVRLPGVLFRADEEGLAATAYRIVLHTVRVAEGAVRDELAARASAGPHVPAAGGAGVLRRLVQSPLALARAASAEYVRHLPGVIRQLVADPDAAAEQALARSVAARVEVVDQVLHALDKAIRAHLADFLGVADLMSLLEGQAAAVLDGLRGDTAGLHELARLFRALLHEQAPVNAVADIANLWRAGRHRPFDDVLRDARQLPALRGRLQGNEETRRRYLVGPRLARLLQQNLSVAAGGERVLRLHRAEAGNVLNRIAIAIRDPRGEALVVEDADLRLHLKALVDTRWPALPVLAIQEVTMLPMHVPVPLGEEGEVAAIDLREGAVATPVSPLAA